MAKIFLIESSPADAQSAREALEARGDVIELTGEAGQAVELARSIRPDLIVLCVELDTGSGYSICNKLRRDVELGQIPLLLTSREASVEAFEQHRRLKTHADRYLHKPYAQSDLLKAIDEMLRRAMPGAADASTSTNANAAEETEQQEEGFASSSFDTSDSSAQHRAGTVELDLSQKALQSLGQMDEPKPGPIAEQARESRHSADSDAERSESIAPAQAQDEASALVFDEQAWEIPDAALDAPAEAREDRTSEASGESTSGVEVSKAAVPDELSKEDAVLSPDTAGVDEAPAPVGAPASKEEAGHFTEELVSIRAELHHLLARLDALIATSSIKK